MKKRKLFAGIMAAVLTAGMMFVADIPVNAQNNSLGQLKVSSVGYEKIACVYGDTVAAMKDGKYGVAKADGTVVLPFEYEEIARMNGDIVVAKKDGKYGIVKLDGTVAAAFEYDECKYFGEKTGVVHLVKVTTEKQINNVYNASGNLIYTKNIDDGAKVVSVMADDGGRVIISTSSATGKYDFEVLDAATGDAVQNIQIKGNGRCFFGNGKIITEGWNSYSAMPDADDHDYHLYENGKTIDIEKAKITGRVFHANGDYILSGESVYDDGNRWKVKYIDVYCYQISTGKCQKIYRAAEGEQNNVYGVTGNNIHIFNDDVSLYALYDINGKALTDFKYTYLEATAEIKPYYLVSDGDKYFYIDSEGKEHGTELKDAGCFKNGNAIVLDKNGEAYIVDEQLNKVSESVKAESAGSFQSQLNQLNMIIVDGKFYPVTMPAINSPEDGKNPESGNKPGTGNDDGNTDANQNTGAEGVVSEKEAESAEKEAKVEGAAEGTKLEVSVIRNDAEEYRKTEAYVKELKAKAWGVLDLKLVDSNNVAVQPDGKIKVTLPVFENIKAAKYVTVYRLDDKTDKFANLGTVEVKDGKFTFETDHFSTYLFVSADKPAEDVKVDAEGKTGDTAPIVPIAGAMAAAILAAGVAAVKKKSA